jgi:hypothetical protein
MSCFRPWAPANFLAQRSTAAMRSWTVVSLGRQAGIDCSPPTDPGGRIDAVRTPAWRAETRKHQRTLFGLALLRLVPGCRCLFVGPHLLGRGFLGWSLPGRSPPGWGLFGWGLFGWGLLGWGLAGAWLGPCWLGLLGWGLLAGASWLGPLGWISRTGPIGPCPTPTSRGKSILRRRHLRRHRPYDPPYLIMSYPCMLPTRSRRRLTKSCPPKPSRYLFIGLDLHG